MLPRLSEPFHTGHNKIEGSKNTLSIKIYTSGLFFFFFKPSKNNLKVLEESLWSVQALPTQWPGVLSPRFLTKKSLKITFYFPSKQDRDGSVKWQYHSPLFLGRAHARGSKRTKVNQGKVPTTGVTLLWRWWLTFEATSEAKPKKLLCNVRVESMLSNVSLHKQHTQQKDVWINASKDQRSCCELRETLTFQTENEEVISKDIQMTELCSPKQLFWVCEALPRSNSQMLSAASYLQREPDSEFTN